MTDDKQHLPEESGFQNIGRNHNRYRGSIRGLNEIFGQCLVSFGWKRLMLSVGLFELAVQAFRECSA